MSKIKLILVFIVYFLISCKSALAKIEINNSPSKIEINKEFVLDVALSNLSDPTHFLSIALHKNTGDSYFGQTQNGDKWIEADDNNCKNFPQVSVAEGSWSGKLKGKINYNEKDFNNSLGNYILKVFKYTDSCNKSSSTDLSVELYDTNPPPTSTPTLKPTSIPTSTPPNSPVPSATAKPQNSPTAYVAVTTAKTITNSPSIKLTDTIHPTDEKSQGIVLGEVVEPSITKTEQKQSLVATAKKNTLPIFALLFGSGIVFIAGAVVVSIRQIKKTHN